MHLLGQLCPGSSAQCILAWASWNPEAARALIALGGHAAATRPILGARTLEYACARTELAGPGLSASTVRPIGGLLLIVFAESGLLIGFFLPGDSLLFTTGLLVTTGKLDSPLWLVCALVALAAIIGDQVGYLFGKKVG